MSNTHVEIFLREASDKRNGPTEKVVALNYQDMAMMHTQTIVGLCDFDVGEGKYKIGIRDCGDERYFVRFELGELEQKDAPYIVCNYASAVLNHYRQ